MKRKGQGRQGQRGALPCPQTQSRCSPAAGAPHPYGDLGTRLSRPRPGRFSSSAPVTGRARNRARGGALRRHPALPARPGPAHSAEAREGRLELEEGRGRAARGARKGQAGLGGTRRAGQAALAAAAARGAEQRAASPATRRGCDERDAGSHHPRRPASGQPLPPAAAPGRLVALRPSAPCGSWPPRGVRSPRPSGDPSVN